MFAMKKKLCVAVAAACLAIGQSAMACYYPYYGHDKHDDERIAGANLPSGSAKRSGTFAVDGMMSLSGAGVAHAGDAEAYEEGLSLSADYYYSSFDDSVLGSSGDVHEYSLGMTKSFSEDTTGGLVLSRTRYETGAFSGILSRAIGLTGYLHTKLDENYGVGAYAYYNWIDIEATNNNTYAWGGGLVFTTYHELNEDGLNLSTATALSKNYFDTNHDTNLVVKGRLGQEFDGFGIGFSTTFNDSLRSETNEDNTYVTFGLDASFYVNESLTLTAAYEKNEWLENYDDNNFYFGLNYNF